MITTIIPVYNLNYSRKRNLEFVYSRLKDQLPDSRIIISVQSSSEDYNYYKKFDEVVYFKNSFKTFNKSALINYSLDNVEIQSDFVMLLDGDIYFKFKSLEDQIPILSDEKVIKPFSECVYLTEPHTLEFINKRKITLSGGLKKISALGGGAIILKSSLIKDSSVRYDENFSGWGWEDIDFGDNIRSKFSIKTLQQPAIHLYHPVINEPTNNYVYYKHKNKPKNKIVHTFSHACVDQDHRLHAAQTNALQSLFVAKKNLDVLLLNACSEFCINNDNIKTIQLNKTAKDIGYERDLPYLDDVINSALPYVEDDGWVVYTNSDCVVEDKFYENILKYNYDYIEFKRQDVDDKGNHLRSISRGVDGFAIRKKILEKTPMPKLIIGAPYWDDVVSKIYSKKADKFMTINNELTHLDHKATYDLNKLDIAGEFNYKKLSGYTHNYFKEESFVVNHSGIHFFPYESTKIQDVAIRQEMAIDSYLANKIPEVRICSFGKQKTKEDKIEHFKISDINQGGIKCNRDYYFLGDILGNSLQITEDQDYIIYTNSDCYIKEKFYDFILSSNYDYIEFFRLETLNDMVVGQNKDGIDGFAIKNQTLKKLISDKILPENLILGAPYWDAVFSSIARKYISNKYQDTVRLYHTKHEPRWSFKNLDYAGEHNLSVLNNLYNNKIINCRKAEIQSDNLVIRVIDSDTDMDRIRDIVCNERFGTSKISDYEYNYLFIEKINNQNPPRLSDETIGTTAGTRYFASEGEIEEIIKHETSMYKRFVMLQKEEKLLESTQFISDHSNSNLGIVFCFFGDDKLRIEAAQKAIKQFKQQTIWKKSKVVFVELIDKNQDNFDFSSEDNVIHLKIQQKDINKNLFQKECLWNIGAQKILKNIDNLIFIDVDTFPQNKHLFAKANKILNNNPNIVFQLGNCVITQKEDGFISRVQWLYSSFSKLNAQNSYCFNPCGGFAISKKIFLQINGFNPYGFLYGGDILFLYEIDKRTHKIWNYEINMKIFKDMPRKINNHNILIKNEEAPLIHCWHGDHEERPYSLWGRIFEELDFDKNEISIDKDGLLSWSNIESQKKYSKFFENRKHITDLKIHKKLYS